MKRTSGYFAFAIVGLLPTSALADSLDDYIKAQMRERHIPGLSLAIINDGRIVNAKGYGVTVWGGAPVTTATLFQAGSISKSVAAVAALQLVEQGKLSLDGNVNDRLVSWKIPDNDFTRDRKVTLRGILSHTAGLTVHGFYGYAADSTLPTLRQVLDGVAPANSEAIRVDVIPGSQWRYSGGGYTVMQQLMVDVSGGTFPELMRASVLEPSGMSSSTYQQPLPVGWFPRAATAHLSDRSPLVGQWHVYPEMAAAGLWTTPTDLAQFAMALQRAVAGGPNPVLSASMAQQMLTDQKEHDGLGVFLEGSGEGLRFAHDGRDEGFDARLIAYAHSGQGIVLMINTNDDSRMMMRIISKVAETFRWREFPHFAAQAHHNTPVPERKLASYAGYYEWVPGDLVGIAARPDGLQTLANNLPDERYGASSDVSFSSTERARRLTFIQDATGTVNAIVWQEGGSFHRAPRLAPLTHSLKARPDPHPVLTREFAQALLAIYQGGAALQHAARVTAGVRRDYASPDPYLAGSRTLTLQYLTTVSVAGQAIERHGSPVDHVEAFEVKTDKATHRCLLYVTADSDLADMDQTDD